MLRRGSRAVVPVPVPASASAFAPVPLMPVPEPCVLALGRVRELYAKAAVFQPKRSRSSIDSACASPPTEGDQGAEKYEDAAGECGGIVGDIIGWCCCCPSCGCSSAVVLGVGGIVEVT